MTPSRILVVDDTPFNRRLLVRLLEGIGHVAVEAPDGRQALDRLRDADAEPIDLVLLDIVMPDMDGHETLAALKADGALRDLPVIVISGVDELDSVVRCIRMGAADYLPKTVDPEILRARIDASLAQKRLRDNERELLATIDRQRSQLARFLSPQVAALVSSADGEQMLAGHRREITAMFCDLRNFTAFSETAEPEEVLGFLRAYHAAMGALIVEHDATLEHFAGDGFMTFFNDPVLQPDHAARAIAPGRGDARGVRRAGGRLAAARPRARAGDRHRDGLRDARPDRLRGSVRLRGHRQRDHPGLAPQRRGRGRRDPRRGTDLRRSGGGGLDHRRARW